MPAIANRMAQSPNQPIINKSSIVSHQSSLDRRRLPSQKADGAELGFRLRQEPPLDLDNAPLLEVPLHRSHQCPDRAGLVARPVDQLERAARRGADGVVSRIAAEQLQVGLAKRADGFGLIAEVGCARRRHATGLVRLRTVGRPRRAKAGRRAGGQRPKQELAPGERSHALDRSSPRWDLTGC